MMYIVAGSVSDGLGATPTSGLDRHKYTCTTYRPCGNRNVECMW